MNDEKKESKLSPMVEVLRQKLAEKPKIIEKVNLNSIVDKLIKRKKTKS